MTENAKLILDAALALPQEKRAEIAHRLIRSLDGPEPTAAEQAEIDAAWDREIARRLKEIDEGKAELIPYEQVMKHARQLLRDVKQGKKSMKVRLLAAAQAEFLEALTYYEGQRDGLGRSFAADFHERVSKIKDRPASCPLHLHGTRRRRLDRFPYGIVFRATDREIWIVAVMHLSRRPGYWKGRD